jgi:hypothetical protein
MQKSPLVVLVINRISAQHANIFFREVRITLVRIRNGIRIKKQ